MDRKRGYTVRESFSFTKRQKKPVRQAGDLCRKCSTPTVEYHRPADEQTRIASSPFPGKFWYAWWLVCPGCQTLYFLPEAKRPYLKQDTASLFPPIADDLDEADQEEEKIRAMYEKLLIEGDL